LVDDRVIVEIKAAHLLMAGHEAQLLNYLKATNISNDRGQPSTLDSQNPLDADLR